MALTATATQGFEFVQYVDRDFTMWVPGDVGDTFTRGDLVTFTLGEGVADPLASNEVPLGVVNTTVTTPALATGFPKGSPGNNIYGQLPANNSNTLVEIRPLVPWGTPVTRATFANHADDTVTAYNAATPSLTGTVALGGNDDPNGALLYVHTGTGAGQWNVVADYVTATQVYTLHRAFEVALSTDSEFIVLEGEGGGAALGVGVFGRCVPADANNITVNDGADDGDLTVFMDAREIVTELSNLRLKTIPSAVIHMV